MMEERIQYPITEATEQETKPETFSRQIQTTQSATKKKKSNNYKRRFSDEQIKLLESVFESDTKLEPRKKLQVARELGLEPRQVAVWFQNRRARWKSKQIEKEYKLLRADYDNLVSCFESLKNERQSLLVQLRKLSDLLGEASEEPKSIGKETGATNTTRIQHHQQLDKNNNSSNVIVVGSSQNDRIGNSRNEERHEQQQILLNRSQHNDGSLVLFDKWGGSDLCGGQFDISRCSSTGNASHWFNFQT